MAFERMQSWSDVVPGAVGAVISPQPGTRRTHHNHHHHRHRSASHPASQATASSDVSREAGFFVCHGSASHTENVTPFSNGLFLSDDATVDASSPVTTAATSLVHFEELQDCDRSSAKCVTTTAGDGMYEASSAHPSMLEEEPLGSPGACPLNAPMYTATGSACSWPQPQDACSSMLTQAMTSVHGPSLTTPPAPPFDLSTASTVSAAPPAMATTAALPHTGALGAATTTPVSAPVGADTTYRSDSSSGSGEVVASPSPRGPARVPVRLHWCCAAHWRAVRQMERGVQAPAALLATDGSLIDAESATSDAVCDVYCVPAQAKRVRQDGAPGPLSGARATEPSLHPLSEDSATAAAKMTVRTLPSFISVTASMLPNGTSSAGEAHTEATLCCEFCGRVIEAYNEAYDESVTTAAAGVAWDKAAESA